MVEVYLRLKERLFLSHRLTAIQMVKRILDMPELGDRRPSQLLAAMMEFCPEGEVANAFFWASFLLPALLAQGDKGPADRRGEGGSEGSCCQSR